MMIPYVTKAWNPIDGCTPVSEGCKNCWADDMAHRFWGERQFNQVTYHQDKLLDPFHWQKPQTVAVSFMGDLFHESISPIVICKVWAVMALNPQHRFLVLTKRAERMYSILQAPAFANGVRAFMNSISTELFIPYTKPMYIYAPNVWLGVSVENQRRADERIPFLMDTPAARRWVSIEPMLGPVVLSRLPCGPDWFQDVLTGYHYKTDFTDE